MPVDPGPSRWLLPDPAGTPRGTDVVAVGGKLDAPTALAGYRTGLFAMASRRRLVWFSPDPRGVLPVDGFHASRSLRRSSAAFRVSIDHGFEPVLAACADPARSGGFWLDRTYQDVYRQLFDLGWAHTIEVWSDGELAGGLLGVELGGLFCGETMFHRRTDASKAAVWATCTALGTSGAEGRVFDVQWLTPHLASLGAREVPRGRYLADLGAALERPAALEPMGAVPMLQFAGLNRA